MLRGTRGIWAGMLVGLALLALPGAAAAYTDVSETNLLSATPDGGFPNGPSRNGVFSQDAKSTRYAAYESDASNLVPGDLNGTTDVFVVSRAQPYDESGKDAPAWKAGGTQLISVGMGGQPADGPSGSPDLDGDQLHKPHCVAFISSADNLVPGDTNGVADAFVTNLDTAVTTRVSVNSLGGESNGPTTEVQVDGACDRVAFVSEGTNLALTGTGRAAFKPYVTSAPPPGTRQVYVRIIGKEFDDKGLTGLTFLASASNKGKAANGDSYQVTLGKLGDSCPIHCGTTSGDTLAFTTAADNLSPQDGNNALDVYERLFVLSKVTFRNRDLPRKLNLRTRLVSAGPDGNAGNGASDEPSVNDSGKFVGFRTLASDLLPGDNNGTADVAVADMSGAQPALTQVSDSAATGHGNGPSGNPSVSRPGSPIYFESDATNLQPAGGRLEDRNDARDVFFWNIKSRNASIESRDSDNNISGLPAEFGDEHPHVVNSDATDPATSAYANYFLFESSNPVLDKSLAERAFPGLRGDPDRAATLARTDPTLHQVYERYFGP
jgi:hypothetical protein